MKLMIQIIVIWTMFFFKVACVCPSQKKCFDVFRYHNHLKNIGQYSLEKFHMILLTNETIELGPPTIRRTPLPTFLVNFSTFAFLLNFSFTK